MIRINLLAARAAKKRDSIRQEIAVAVFCLVCTCSAMMWVQVSLVQKVTSAEAEIQSINKEIERLKVEAREIQELKKKKDTFEKMFNIIRSLREKKAGPVHLMEDLSRSIPGFLWLTSLTEKEKTSEIEIKGKALSNEAIAQFMDNLEKSPSFMNVNLTVTQQVEQKKVSRRSSSKNPELRDFTITCQLEAPKEM